VNRVIPADDLLTAARDYIVDLAAHSSPTSIAVMKRQVYLDLHRGLAAAERDAERLMAESFARADFQEGVQSYLQRRPPEFRRVGAESPPSY
jgi:enoyl-CoA hydratase/carnithine racemase